MSRYSAILLLLLVSLTPFRASADDILGLYGRVKDALTGAELPQAKVLWPKGDGEDVDTIACDQGSRIDGDNVVPISIFLAEVAKKDSVYVFDVVCEGYQPLTVTYRVEKVGKRENYRDMPVCFMKRAPHKLKEVTVTASKIKFYNKGDTVVFNADAFQLAEGSMLDALIDQLPGVELKDDGQILVNGEFVESLLLNGKEFLDGNNRLMLDNIAAYTVKQVEVYKGQSTKDKWLGDTTGDKLLTMDVKLKKQYQIGWLVNAQAGGGTEGRYSGRVFAQWYNPVNRLTLLGNINNLNDTRRPGKSGSWSPDMLPQGTRRYRMAALDYNYTDREEKKNVAASVTFEQTRTDERETRAVTNFLGQATTYDNSFARARITDTRLNSNIDLRGRNDRLSGYLSMKGNYRRKSADSDNLSGTFDREQADIDRDILENIYTEADPSRLEAIINRASTRTDGSSRQVDLRVTPGGSFHIPGTGDDIRFETYFRYNDLKEELWKDYTVNFGADPTPAERRRQYFDNSPNRTITSVNNLSYHATIGHWYVGLNYEYRFSDVEKDSYMYALERLEDMGMFGKLPSGYLAAFDPANSYTSRLIENSHAIEPSVSRGWRFTDADLYIRLRPSLKLRHDHLDYWRDGRSQLVRQSDFLVSASRYDLSADFSFAERKSERGRPGYIHNFSYRGEIDPKMPDPFDLLDVVNDADPLNIILGNPDLATAWTFSHTLEYNLAPPAELHPLHNNVKLTLSHTDNALVRGYVYDTHTGVRTTRTYNVDGNSSASASNTFRLQFGRANQFSLSSITDASLQRYADMIGIDREQPERSRVSTRTLGEKLNLTWQIGKQSLRVSGSMSLRRSTSPREDFTPINARHYSYGLTGDFRLPAGIGITTDFTVYTRRGYGLSYLDTSDAIWNLRVSYTPPSLRRLTFMLDGFDLLRQLSNVNYAVDAAGRTVSYTNTLPRYILLSVQYSFSIQPRGGTRGI